MTLSLVGVRASSVLALCVAIAPFANAQDGGAEKQADTIVVTATRTEKPLLETPAAVTVQAMSDLRERGFTYGTDEFRGVPGVFFRQGEGDGDEFPFVTIRGVTGNHGNDTFLALIDGIPFVGPDEEVLLTEAPYSALEKIEIVRGPVSALYGRGAIAGAVNYLTRAPVENGGRLEFTGGSDGYYRAAAGAEAVLGDVAFLADVSYENYEGWRDNSAREIVNVFLKGVWSASEATTLTGYLNYLDRFSEVASAIPTYADGALVDVIGGRESFLGYSPSDNDREGFIGALRLNHDFTQALDIQLTAQARRFDTSVNLNFYDPFGFDPSRNVMGVNGFASEGVSTIFVGEALLNWRAGRHTLVVGASAERASLDEADQWSGQNGFTFECGFTFFLIEIDYAAGEVLNADHPCFAHRLTRSSSETTNTFWSVFAQDEIALTPDLKLTVGARYDGFHRRADFDILGAAPVDERVTGEEGAVSPKASLAWNVGRGVLYASYGRGFNSNFGPVWQWDATQYERVEQPTTIDSIEIGWKGVALDGRLEWETALFYLRQRNRRIFVENPDPSGPPNLATTGQLFESKGLELSVRARPTASTQLTLSYTYLDPEWLELTLDTFAGPVDLSGNAPTGVADHIFYADARQEITDWLSLRASYERYSDYQVTQDNSVEAGAYDLVNLSIIANIPGRDDLSLTLSALNLLDEEYFYFFGGQSAATNATPGAPRQFRATIRKTF